MFISDHGEEFGEHQGWFHGETLYAEMVDMPLAEVLAIGEAQLERDYEAFLEREGLGAQGEQQAPWGKLGLLLGVICVIVSLVLLQGLAR